MNIFRILGDVSHTASKCILIWAIHSNKSAEGVSLITQALYVAVFVTRYLDLFWVSPKVSMWNFVLKNFYILSSMYIIFLMMRVYARTREREKAWRLGMLCLGGSLIAAPIISLSFDGWKAEQLIRLLYPERLLWVFSIILESVCVLPQLLLLRQTTVPTVIDSFYLVTLGSYRAFYILNWVVRLASKEHFFDPIATVFGILQTALYIDFAWVYWTRQRVKLRGGGVVDSEDLSRGWLISRILGQRGGSMDEEERPALDGEDDHRVSGRTPARNTSKWGARGISVSADEDILSPSQKTKVHPGDSKARDDELAGILEDDGDIFDDTGDFHERSGDANGLTNETIGGITHGEEWRDGVSE
ncbi:MAG: hypothetical protein M1827_003769 [Pycnora praestabilis]|nr:MAG: hypothetical protein M1827_003769 [Pycnora praestabilis]